MKKLFSLLFCLCLGIAAFGQTEGFVKSGDVNIHYMTFGEGAPLVILNGGPGMSCEGFVPLAQQLSKGYQTILFDQRGTGQSTMNSLTASRLTMDWMVKDMEALREHLKLEKWVVMGHSFGGMLASYYATKHPERVRRMILSSSGGIDLSLFDGLDIRAALSPNDRDSLAYWSGRIQSGDTSYHARYQRGKHLAPAYLYDKKYIPVVAERLTQGNMQVNGMVWGNMREMNFDCKEALKTFQPAVLILHGKQDVLDESIPRNTADILPNAQLVFLDKCAHYGWLDQEKQYFEAIFEFLGEGAGKASP